MRELTFESLENEQLTHKTVAFSCCQPFYLNVFNQQEIERRFLLELLTTISSYCRLHSYAVLIFEKEKTRGGDRGISLKVEPLSTTQFLLKVHRPFACQCDIYVKCKEQFSYPNVRRRAESISLIFCTRT